MAIITLTTDFGHKDAYVAILKAAILSLVYVGGGLRVDEESDWKEWR